MIKILKEMTTKEFSEEWRKFGVESGRFRISTTGRMTPIGLPSVTTEQEKGMNYTVTSRYKWIVETFKKWVKYKKDNNLL